MSLLKEFIALDYDRNLVKEATEQKKPVILKKALLQRYDAPNQNNRIYPKHILQREVRKYQDIVADNRATGEADHPESSVVELKNVSHIIREIWEEGNEIYGMVEILNTPAGNIVKNLMEAGVKIGISSRGVGETIKNESGHDVVSEDFALIAFDLVSEPSTHHAFLAEGIEIKQGISKIDRINSIISDILGR